MWERWNIKEKIMNTKNLIWVLVALGFFAISCQRDHREDNMQAQNDEQRSQEDQFAEYGDRQKDENFRQPEETEQSENEQQSEGDMLAENDEQAQNNEQQPKNELQEQVQTEQKQWEENLYQENLARRQQREENLQARNEERQQEENLQAHNEQQRLAEKVEPQEITRISGTVHCVMDDKGNVKDCEIRDEQGNSFVVHKEGLGQDMHRLVDAKIQANGRTMDVEGRQGFHINSYKAVVEIPGKLTERGENNLVFEEISFEETPIFFQVINRGKQLEKLDIPLDKPIKANGLIVKGEESRPEDPADANPQEWMIRIDSYQPLEIETGVVSLDKSDDGDLKLTLREEASGATFKAKERAFEITNSEGRGGMLVRKYANKKVKCYVISGKNEHGERTLAVLACEPQEGEEESHQNEEKQDQSNHD